MMKNIDDTVFITSKVNEIFASTELIQYFTNPLDNPIELTILFPIMEELSLIKFVVSIDDQIVISKVMPKKKAEEKYNDTIASGNVGFISRYEEEDKTYSVNIGNLKPKTQIKLYSIFIQMIGTQDMSYEFAIMEKYPSFYYKGIESDDNPKNKKINAHFEIEAKSKITRLIAPFYDEQAKLNPNIKYSVEYSPDYKKAKIEYLKVFDEIENKSKDKKGKPSFYLSFSILFRTEKMNNPILYTQYNPELKETAFSINYIYASKNLKAIPIPEKPDEDINISYAGKYVENVDNETPGLFIFLIDQSGSMRGEPIELVKKALLLFIQSLPANSYFQLIGFGSDFKKYNNEPVIYNKENVDNIIKIINGLDADLGGTNINAPLRSIFNDDCYSKINLSRNIFLLTDGAVRDRKSCIKLITTNSSRFRINSLGIGNDFDQILIEQCGKVGKGTSSFIKDLKKINSVVIDVLNKSLRPYITEIKFDFENHKEDIESNIITVNPTNNFTYQNEIMNYSFILPGKIELYDLKIRMTGKDPINLIEENVSFDNLIKLENGEEMGKMIVGKALKNNKELTKDEEKEIQFAKKYQILSKNTALFAQIISEQRTESKLIEVDLNQYEQEEEDVDSYSYSKNCERSYRACCSPSKGCFEAKKSKKKAFIGGDFFGGLKDKVMGLFSSKESSSNNIVSQSKSNNNKKIDDRTKLIMSQDIIEGAWDENDDTKKLISIISSSKFDKIKNKIKTLNKGTNETKIIYTILVIYYLKKKCADKLNEYRLVINKANKFLEKNSINYDDIITEIKI